MKNTLKIGAILAGFSFHAYSMSLETFIEEEPEIKEKICTLLPIKGDNYTEKELIQEIKNVLKGQSLWAPQKGVFSSFEVKELLKSSQLEMFPTEDDILIGNLYYQVGIQTKESKKKEYYLEKASDLWHAKAQLDLAMKNNSYKYLYKAAAQGYLPALYELACDFERLNSYYGIDEVIQDKEKRLKYTELLLKEAEQRGSEDATYYLYVMRFSHGLLNTKPSLKQALLNADKLVTQRNSTKALSFIKSIMDKDTEYLYEVLQEIDANEINEIKEGFNKGTFTLKSYKNE